MVTCFTARPLPSTLSEISYRKWKLKDSLKSQLCQMAFCWDKNVKACFPEADTGGRMSC